MSVEDVRTPSPGSELHHAEGAFDNEIKRLNQEWREKRDQYKSSSRACTPVPEDEGQGGSVLVPPPSPAIGACSRSLPALSLREAPFLRSPTGTHGKAQSSSLGSKGPERRDGGLAAAAACGSLEACREILANGETVPCIWGPDGTTPLCAAALWGHADVVRFLLSAQADPGLANQGGAGITALHAAALHEHGKVCMVLLEARADPLALDCSRNTPSDYAACSEAVWPIFAAAGCARNSKEVLISKGVIRKVSTALEQELEALAAERERSGQGAQIECGLLPEFSRPGSAYVVAVKHPPRPGSALPPGDNGGSAVNSRPGSSARMTRTRPIDILAEGDEAACAQPKQAGNMDASHGNLRSLGL